MMSSQPNGSSSWRSRRTCTSTVRPPAVMFFGHAPRNSSSRLKTRPWFSSRNASRRNSAGDSAHLLAAHEQTVHGFVEHERAGRQLVGPNRGERSAQARVDACDELGRLERQREAIVGAELERCHGVRHIALLGPDDEAAAARRVGVAQLRQRFAGGAAAEPRQARSRRAALGRRPSERPRSRACFGDFAAGLHQRLARRCAQRLLVVDQQYRAVHVEAPGNDGVQGGLQHARFAVVLRHRYGFFTRRRRGAAGPAVIMRATGDRQESSHAAPRR